MKKIFFFLPLLSLLSCYDVERNCKDFKTGKFKSEVMIDSLMQETISIRTDDLVIETFQGKTDTASIRWINDCEYILQKLNPKNMAEKKSVSIKILSTSKDSYTFEFGVIGNNKKLKGTATKIN